MPQMSEEQRQHFMAESVGKTIEEIYWEDVDKYWVITFTDGSEISVRLMNELFGTEHENLA